MHRRSQLRWPSAACELSTGVVLVDLERCVHLGAAALRALAEAAAPSTRKGFRLRITAQRPPLITALTANSIPREIVAGGGTALTLVPDSQPDASPARPCRGQHCGESDQAGGR